MTPDVDQLMIFEHAVDAASHRDSRTTVDTDLNIAPSSSISYHTNNSTDTVTTVSDRQRSASAAVNWSAWQLLPVQDVYRLSDYDDAAYDYNDDDVEDYSLNDERLKTKTERLNANGTEGRSQLVSTGWAKKSKPDNFCNNFVYCQPIFIIFGTCTVYTIRNLQLEDI